MNPLISDTPSGIGLTEAASRFEALAEPSDTQTSPDASQQHSDNAETKKQVEASAADTSLEETPPSDTADTGDDEPLEDEEIEAGDDDADDEEGAEEEEAPAEDEDDPADTEKLMARPFTVKIGGKEEQVTLKEALAGYQRQADYTRSKMALADEKRAFASDREAIQTERQQYAQLLPVLIQQIEAGMEQEPDWEDLLANKPEEYIRQEVLWREKQGRLVAARQEQARLNEEKARENHANLMEAVAHSGEELAKAMPQWKDQARWDSDRAKLLEYGQKIGFSKQEMEQTYDHRAVLTLWKASRYDELMAKKPQPDKRPGAKPAPSGSSVVNRTRKPNELSRAKQRLAKSGSVRDAASLFEQLDP
jgi:hypothetical protein